MTRIIHSVSSMSFGMGRIEGSGEGKTRFHFIAWAQASSEP